MQAPLLLHSLRLLTSSTQEVVLHELEALQGRCRLRSCHRDDIIRCTAQQSVWPAQAEADLVGAAHLMAERRCCGTSPALLLHLRTEQRRQRSLLEVQGMVRVGHHRCRNRSIFFFGAETWGPDLRLRPSGRRWPRDFLGGNL